MLLKSLAGLLTRAQAAHLSAPGAQETLASCAVTYRTILAQHQHDQAPVSILTKWCNVLQDSLWLATPKKKVSPSRRGKRNAGKFRRRAVVLSRCKECNMAFPIHQLARCKADNCPGRYSHAT